MVYDWYEIAEGCNITQGDIIENCPVFFLPEGVNIEPGQEVEIDVKIIDVIIMTQACDLEQEKVDEVLLCGLIDAKEAMNPKGKPLDKGDFKTIKDGKTIGLHLLSKSQLPEMTRNYRVVDLKKVYTLPVATLKSFVENSGQRLRLLPPYREHLSQAFARIFMRVGLPSDIDINDIDIN